MNLYWGDTHVNLVHARDMECEADAEAAFLEAQHHLDFFMPAYYPAHFYQEAGGLETETAGMRPEFADAWRMLVELCRRHNAPSELVCFPGYEWTGNRTRYGDVNVFYFDDGPLDLVPELPELQAHLRDHRALVIPHHTAYKVRQRGRDWDAHDSELTPVMEIYSAHGCSEADAGPMGLRRSTAMGPSITGGTFHDALARGLRVGVIASGDKKHRFGGVWGAGLAGVWAEELTKESIWKAFFARRTYGVTGDRIILKFAANGAPMGSEIASDGEVEFAVNVAATDAVDRIELIRDGRVIATHNHRDTWEQAPPDGPLRLKARFEFGWGPSPGRGFPPAEKRWDVKLLPHDGRLLDLEGCFTMGGQRVRAFSPRECRLDLRTPSDKAAVPYGRLGTPLVPVGGQTGNQSVVIEAQLEPDGALELEAAGLSARLTVADLLGGSRVLADVEDSAARIEDICGEDPREWRNTDPIYYNAWRLKVHRAWPSDAYEVDCAFRDRPAPGTHSYYVRVSEVNGHMAWSSPVWIEQS